MKSNLLLRKLLKLSAVFPIALLFSESLYAQCLTNTEQYPSATVVPTYFDGVTPNEVSACNYEEEYAVVQVNANQYHIFYSSNPNTYITISANNGVSAVAHGTGQVAYTSTTAGTVRVYFNANASCGTYDDCIETKVLIGPIPTCFTPLGITYTNLTNNSVNFSWNAASPAPSGGYEYYYGSPATPPTASTTASGTTTTTSASLSSLTSNTEYGFWVRSVCGTNDKSNWSMMSAFTTQHIVSRPWTEGFTVNGIIPDGFTANDNFWFVDSDPGYFDGNPGDFLGVNQYMPVMYKFETVNISGIQSYDTLHFDYRYFDAWDAPLAPVAGEGYFKVYISSDFGQTYTQIDSINNNTTAVWTSKSYPLSAHAGQTIRVKIESYYTSASGFGDYFLGFDNFSVNGTCTAPAATGISITNNDLEYNFAVTGAQNANTYDWDFGDGNSGTGQSTSHTYTTGGNYTVTVTLINECDTTELTENITVSVNINELGLDNNQLKLYPNPAKNNLQIENLSNQNMKSVTVYNILGQKMEFVKVAGAKNAALNLSKYANGIYSMVIEFESGTVTRKFEVLK